MNKKHKIVDCFINDLIPSEYNPRKISDKDFEELKISLDKFSAVQPAVINIKPGRKNIIIGGHQRIKAAKALDWVDYPCISVSLDQDAEKELNIRLNKNVGEFVPELLEKYFEVDNLVDWGFDSSEVDWGGFEGEPNEKEIDENLETDTECPKCGYKW